MRRLPLTLAVAISLVLASGCGVVRASTTERTSQEMLLITTAAERAVKRFDLASLDGERVFLDVSAVPAQDRGYVVDAVEQHLEEAGAIQVDAPGRAGVILEVRSGTLASDERRFGFEIPLPPLPTKLKKTIQRTRRLVGSDSDDDGEDPLASELILGFFFDKQAGWAKLQGFAWRPKTGEYLGDFEGWGYARVGWFGESILPEKTLKETAESYGE